MLKQFKLNWTLDSDLGDVDDGCWCRWKWFIPN
jgi:hypothetical protein